MELQFINFEMVVARMSFEKQLFHSHISTRHGTTVERGKGGISTKSLAFPVCPKLEPAELSENTIGEAPTPADPMHLYKYKKPIHHPYVHSSYPRA
jgi:hypothetical protein